MDEITSVEFRKRYAKLTEPTVVTVLGRPIGTWTPLTPAEPYLVVNGARAELPVRLTPQDRVVAVYPTSRPFTPAPKPGRKMG